MRQSLRSHSNSKSLSKLDEELDKLIEEEINSKNKLSSLKNVWEEEEELTEQIPEDLDKKVLELAEGRELDLANSKKNKLRKKSIDILNEHIDDLYQKTINESKAETKGTDSLSKHSKLGRKRKRLYRKKKDSDEEYNINSESDDNKSVNSFMNDDSNYEKDYLNEDSSYIDKDEQELIDYFNNRECQKKGLLKYKEIYNKKRNHLIVLDDEDELTNKKGQILPSKENGDSENEKRHFKRLKKNTDNKEMQLPLDTECIICTCNITELANPDGCNHNFCKSCLIEWTKRSSKCPMCKKYYKTIFTYDKGQKRQISIFDLRHKETNIIKDSESNNEENEIEEEIDDLSDVGCYICGKNTEPDKLLVCDRCRANCCHYYCDNLKKIPKGKWYCSFCVEEIKEIKQHKKNLGHFFL